MRAAAAAAAAAAADDDDDGGGGGGGSKRRGGKRRAGEATAAAEAGLKEQLPPAQWPADRDFVTRGPEKLERGGGLAFDNVCVPIGGKFLFPPIHF